MATVPSKHHQPLHNFPLPLLKWGQRIHVNNHFRRRYRYRNSPSPITDSSNNRGKPHRNRNNTAIDGENSGVLPEKGKSDGRSVDVDVARADDGDVVKPWNLRPRRLVIDSSDGAIASSAKSGRLLRGVASAAEAAGEEEDEKEHGKKRRLWISLSKEEIEEDVYAFTGSKPARRPKKRNKTAQKHVDNVFPGLYLVGISADSYRV